MLLFRFNSASQRGFTAQFITSEHSITFERSPVCFPLVLSEVRWKRNRRGGGCCYLCFCAVVSHNKLPCRLNVQLHSPPARSYLWVCSGTCMQHFINLYSPGLLVIRWETTHSHTVDILTHSHTGAHTLVVITYTFPSNYSAVWFACRQLLPAPTLLLYDNAEPVY